MSDEQRRQLVDCRQVFDEYRAARARWDQSFTGSMRWVTRKGTEYLHHKRRKRERSLGRRSPETEARYRAFVSGRAELEERLAQLSARLDRMAPVNRALQLGRVPTIAARVLRKLDDEGLLGSHLLVVGTNALFAYEAAAGVLLGAGLLATGDADLLRDARQGIDLVTPEVRRDGVLGLLQKVDRTFAPRSAGDYRAINADGYYVDLIRPQDDRVLRGTRPTLGDRADDLRPSPIAGLEWLVNAPRFEATAMGADGYPVRLVTPDPRAFALHKRWLAAQPRRDPLKRSRDHAQALAAAEIAQRYLALAFDAPDLAALPRPLRDLAADLQPASPGGEDDPPGPGW
jgi:hypothetical protein